MFANGTFLPHGSRRWTSGIGGKAVATRASVARGHGWFDELVNGRSKSIAEIAEREGTTGRYVARLFDLAFLPPVLVEDSSLGQPVEMTTVRIRAEQPMVWSSTYVFCATSPPN